MKILICGLGSIGSRHTQNLLNLGFKNLILVTSKKIKNRKFKKLKKYNSLDEALNEKPELAFICNSTHLHAKSALNCMKKNVNVFIEKPIGNKKKELDQLLSFTQKTKIKSFVGYMMRFHPAISKIKDIIKNNSIGEIFHFSSYWGEYLPNWHKNENFKKSYAANESMGGGPALTLSHELDLASYLFGNPTKVEKYDNGINYLKINSRNVVDFHASFKKNISGFIHLDYLQILPHRTLMIIGTKGKIFF
ncbi:Gfo/Idh/MocA family oxidoreductase, partial [Candidatus Pelagibacter sp.]|nr:Gfo/Idh/MocA family oxidoreductase [Candidatus Pelagibacter sp.]MDC3158017.1 Gfo/Idh/MocA family oxidoreductase [Candidatus Pelagibacter sp.]